MWIMFSYSFEIFKTKFTFEFYFVLDLQNMSFKDKKSSKDLPHFVQLNKMKLESKLGGKLLSFLIFLF